MSGAYVGMKLLFTKLVFDHTAEQKVVRPEPGSDASATRMKAAYRNTVNAIDDAVPPEAEAPKVEDCVTADFREQQIANSVCRAI